MTNEEKQVRFIQGSDSNYLENQSSYTNAIYFATDVKKLYLNGGKYGDARREIQVVNTLGKATEYFLAQADLIISGAYPSIVQVCGDSTYGTGIATATYEDNKNFRVDAYVSQNPSLTAESGSMCHLYTLYADGQPSLGWTQIDYQYMPGITLSSPNEDFHNAYFKGLKEAWIESRDGRIAEHYWNGSKYVDTVLPTSKEVSTTMIGTYSYNFNLSPTLTYGSTYWQDSFELHQVLLDGVQTPMYCPNSWIISGGQLVVYSDGSRPLVLTRKDGSGLRSGDQIRIKCGSSDLIDTAKSPKTFSWTYEDGMYTLTAESDGVLVVYLNRNKYIHSIAHYSEGTTKTFTISTPSGVKEIRVITDPTSLLNSVTNLEAKFPVNTSDIADSSVTEEKLAFDLSKNGRFDTRWINSIQSNITISTSFPSTATSALVTNVIYDTTANKFIAYATFFRDASTVGDGYYYITNGTLATSIISLGSKYTVSYAMPQNSTPEYNVVYVLAQGSVGSGNSTPKMYYYNGSTLVEFDSMADRWVLL